MFDALYVEPPSIDNLLDLNVFCLFSTLMYKYNDRMQIDKYETGRTKISSFNLYLFWNFFIGF